MKDWIIKEPMNTKLNKIKKTDPEAFYYLYQIYEVLHPFEPLRNPACGKLPSRCFDESFLHSQPAVNDTKFLRHVRFTNPMIIKKESWRSVEAVRRENVFEKALFALVLISYIQAFSDGNKRVARITSNALLIADKHCPISFCTVDSVEYKKHKIKK